MTTKVISKFKTLQNIFVHRIICKTQSHLSNTNQQLRGKPPAEPGLGRQSSTSVRMSGKMREGQKQLRLDIHSFRKLYREGDREENSNAMIACKWK